jgi:hypothetical protein
VRHINSCDVIQPKHHQEGGTSEHHPKQLIHLARDRSIASSFRVFEDSPEEISAQAVLPSEEQALDGFELALFVRLVGGGGGHRRQRRAQAVLRVEYHARGPSGSLVSCLVGSTR